MSWPPRLSNDLSRLVCPSHKGYTDVSLIIQHMKLPELEQSVRNGRLVPDKSICLNDLGELAVTKFAVEPVWYLPGVAERFGIGMTFIQAAEDPKLEIYAFRRHTGRLNQHQTKELCVDLYSKIQEDPFQSL